MTASGGFSHRSPHGAALNRDKAGGLSPDICGGLHHKRHSVHLPSVKSATAERSRPRRVQCLRQRQHLGGMAGHLFGMRRPRRIVTRSVPLTLHDDGTAPARSGQVTSGTSRHQPRTTNPNKTTKRTPCQSPPEQVTRPDLPRHPRLHLDHPQERPPRGYRTTSRTPRQSMDAPDRCVT